MQTQCSPGLILKKNYCSALTANNAFAQKRLQKEGIYCLHTKHINLCGGIDVVAFDKVRILMVVILKEG